MIANIFTALSFTFYLSLTSSKLIERICKNIHKDDFDVDAQLLKLNMLTRKLHATQHRLEFIVKNACSKEYPINDTIVSIKKKKVDCVEEILKLWEGLLNLRIVLVFIDFEVLKKRFASYILFYYGIILSLLGQDSKIEDEVEVIQKIINEIDFVRILKYLRIYV